MRLAKLTLGIAMVASSAIGVSPASAGDFTPAVVGELCGMTMTNDPDIPGERIAEIHGGPVAGYNAGSPTSLSEVYLFCAVQVGGTGVHSDPDAVMVDD